MHSVEMHCKPIEPLHYNAVVMCICCHCSLATPFTKPKKRSHLSVWYQPVSTEPAPAVKHTYQSVHICKAIQLAQAQLRSTAHRRGVTESTKHRNQVQLGQAKSKQILPENRRRDRNRIPYSSAQAASTAARIQRSCAAQQQQREKTEKQVGTQKSRWG